jgi:amino acid adenylation domain-containing protein
LAAQLAVPAEDVLLAAYFSLVARHTASTDLTIGLPRDVPGPFSLATLVGNCGNLLPIRVEVAPGTSFAELVRVVHQRRTEAEQHAALPFKVVLDLLGIEPDPGRLPLVQLGFDPPARATAAAQSGDVRIAAEQVDTGVGTFELAVQATLAGAEPAITVRYVTALYRQQTAARLARRYLRLLQGGCAEPDAEVSDLPFADADEQASVLHAWNRPIGTFPDGTVHQGFARIVQDNGDRVALAWRGGQMTYADLDATANRIAHALIRQGAQPGGLVAVLVERGPAMIAAILGVLKAGAGYVPIDLNQPAERVAAIIEDCGARLALASAAAGDLLGDRLPVVDIDADLTGLPDTAPQAPSFPESLAYVIYTSGSTGRPKGVLIEHRNVTNFVRTVQQMFRLGPDDRVLQFASPGFDVSTFEIFGALLSGSRLYIVDEDERRSIDAVDAVMADQRITVIDLPPAVMELLHPERYPDLRVSFVGGEAFSGELTTRWARRSEFYNGYGPTETTVTVVAKQCQGQWHASPPIGRAMANHRAYVLDADLGLLPPGATGELAIAGLGVGRGYLGRPDLTAERFRPDPYGPPGSRMYLTGDLAVWDDEGDLGFLGRADRQVKVRGVRIELAEVEAALQAVDGVARAIADVAVDPHRGTVLVAYVVPDDGGQLQLDAVRSALGTRLPPTMVPSMLVPLPEVPLTQSGKVDRRALPAVEFAEVEELSDSEHSNSTPTERTVRDEVFAPLLGMRIGNHTNFFASGGTSLQAIRIASRVKAVFDVEVPIADFFATPTVVGLARLVEEAGERDRERRDALAEALELVEGRSDEEIAELTERLGQPRPDN